MPSSYRPISLTSNVSKLFDKMVVCRLKWFLEYYNILTFTQSGFQQRRKTTDRILSLHDIIQKSLANKHNVLAIFIDIEKAYDMVNKNVLLLKLLKFGITGRMFQFISSFLSNRTFQVRVGSTLSMTKLLENGTPQGSVLSPVLFSLMINDLPNKITSPSALYADDFCFWESGSDRRGFTIRLKRLKPRAPDFGEPENFGTNDNFQHFRKQLYSYFCFTSTHVLYFTMPLTKDLL